MVMQLDHNVFLTSALKEKIWVIYQTEHFKAIDKQQNTNVSFYSVHVLLWYKNNGRL